MEGFFMSVAFQGEPTDIELMRAYQAGDSSALALLLGRRQKWLFNVARKTIQNPDLAPDGLQEAMVQIWRGAADFRGDSQVTTWMYQIVTRCCIDLLRKERIRTFESFIPEEHEDKPAESDFESRLADKLLIHGALAELEGPMAECVRMVWIEDLSYEEVSARLEIPIGTVKSRVSRGQARLKIIISEISQEIGNQKHEQYVQSLEVKNVRNFRPRA
jgi:RNA polymerase sigma-70 factor (ECF subfamily)